MRIRRCSSLLLTATLLGLGSSAMEAATLHPHGSLGGANGFGPLAATDRHLAVKASYQQRVMLWRRAPATRVGWVPDGEVNVPGAMTWGSSVAFAGGEQLLVGMPYGRPESRVDVVERSGEGQWRIVQSIADRSFPFGSVLAAHGDRFATVDGPFASVTEVVVYRRGSAGWGVEAHLPVEEPPALGWGWVTLTLSDNLLVCGLGDIPGAQVLVFEHDGREWQRVAELKEPLDSEGFGWGFGWALAVHGDLLAVAAPWARRGGAFGAVDLFRREDSGQWVAIGELVQPEEGAHPYFAGFGSSLAFLPDGRLVVGAPGGGACFGFDCAYRASRLHLFTPDKGEWAESARWTGVGDGETYLPVPPPEDQLGGRLVWSKDQLLTPAGEDSGVRVFTVTDRSPQFGRR